MAIRNPTSVLFAVVALCFAGCTATIPTPRMPPAAPFGHDATLIYVPGIGGLGHADADWVHGLRVGGYDGSMQTYNWSGHRAAISALWDHARQRAEARRIAAAICKLRRKSPASPIILASHSAGAGIVVHALEDLPADMQVDGVVLLAPALSRTYDLTPALRHVHGRADVFCSDRDTMVLAIGTFLFGTVDGVHGEAAGHGGFIRPREAAAVQYAKLHTHYFSRARESLGEDGGHYGPQQTAVAAVLIAPLLPRSPVPGAIIVPDAGSRVVSAASPPTAHASALTALVGTSATFEGTNP